MNEEKHNETIDKVFESWLTEQISHCTNAPSHEVSIWKVYCLSLSFDVDIFLIPPHLILILYVLYIA
jgi:hypothetical protein